MPKGREKSPKRKQFVYTLTKGERYEQSSLIGIYRTLRRAQIRAAEVRSSYGDLADWEEVDTNEWESGCDYVNIVKRQIE